MTISLKLAYFRGLLLSVHLRSRLSSSKGPIPYLKILNSTTSAKTLFSYKVTLIGPGIGPDIFGSHYGWVWALITEERMMAFSHHYSKQGPLYTIEKKNVKNQVVL